MSKFDFANAKFMFEIEDLRFSKWFVFAKLPAKSKGTTLRTSQSHSFALYFPALLYPASSFRSCSVPTLRTVSGEERCLIRLCLLIRIFPPITAPMRLPFATWRFSVPTVKPVSSDASLLGIASGCFFHCLAMYSRSAFAWRQHDAWCRRSGFLRRKSPGEVGKPFGMLVHFFSQGFHIAHFQRVPMCFVAVVLVVDIAVLQHIQEFSLGYMQVCPCRICADNLFHTPSHQKSAPRSVVMPIIVEECADGLRADVFSALVQVRINICRGSDVGMSEIL